MFLTAAVPVIEQIKDLFEDLIVWMYDDAGITWGLGIVLITFISRLVVLPLTLRSMKGMRELQALQPHMKELQEKYKDDRQRLQREQMALFQEHGVNPLASCLPLLLQIPVFFALYSMFTSDSFKDDLVGSGSPGWLFIDNLAEHPEGAVTVVLVLLAVASSFALILVNPSPSTGGASQRWLFAGAFALITVFFIPNAPAGVAVYWIASGVWALGQQGVIRVVWPLPPVPTPEEVRASKPPPPPPRKRKRRR
jgi:YidC/Oxa1 family membrane protein insertase